MILTLSGCNFINIVNENGDNDAVSESQEETLELPSL